MRLNLFPDKNNFEEFDELFDLFVRGKMSPDEEMVFKDKIKSDPELKERAKILTYLIKNIKAVGEERDKIIISAYSQFSSEKEVRDVIGSIEKQEKLEMHEKKVNMRSIMQWSSSIAAILIIGLIFGIQYYNSYKVTSLADKYYMEYDISSNLRGMSEESVKEELLTLIDNVKEEKELKQTISKLKVIYDKALSEEYNEYTNHSTTIAWYMALAYLKDNKKEDAIVVLNKLIKDNPDSAISKMAEKLKNEIINLQ